MGKSQSGGVFQHVGDLLVWSIFQCQTEHGVFNNTVLNASFTQFFTKFGIIGNSDALVINQDTGSRVGEFLFKLSNILLFFE